MRAIPVVPLAKTSQRPTAYPNYVIFLDAHYSNTHLLPGCKAMYHLDPSKKEKALNTLLAIPLESAQGVTLKVCMILFIKLIFLGIYAPIRILE